MIVLVPLVVFTGAFTQRVTGLGFALIASPLLVLLVGPYQGIILANLLSLLVSVAVLATSWRQVDLRRAAVLGPTGLLGVLPGVYLAQRLAPGPLQATVGLLVLVGLTATLAAPAEPLDPGPATTTTAGVASGFMTATAGVGGPALTVYALTTGWRQTAFAATAQVSFATQAALALGLKGVHQLPGPATSAALIAATAVGLTAGHLLTDRVPADLARRAIVVIALAGALSTAVKGFLTW